MSPKEEISRDEQLLKQLRGIILANIRNDQFGVEPLAAEVGMSRSHLHRKVKGLTGKSISNFIRDVRLEEAMGLLEKDTGSISEIAYQTGFQSASYFHKCFQKVYGYPPGDVRKKSSKPADFPDASGQKNARPSKSKSWKVTLGIAIVLLVALLISIIIYNREEGDRVRSIAVLPFQNFTNDSTQAYFIHGFHDGIIGEMGKISGFRVISRTSMLKYKDLDLSIEDIAKELGVDAILEGSVRTTGDEVRIQLYLVDTNDEEKQLWSKDYRQDYANILFLQNDIIRNIAYEVRTTLTESEDQRLARVERNNPDAYRAYLKGMFHWDKLTRKDLSIAMEYFQLALAHDPDYAPAYAGIASVWMGYLQQGMIAFDEGAPQLKAAANKALQLDSTLSEVHTTLGHIATLIEWDFEAGVEHLRRAIESNPNNAKARAFISHALNILHQPNEAMSQIELAKELDPFNPLILAMYGMDLLFAREFDRAIAELTLVLERSPQDPLALSTLRTAYHMKQMHRDALKIWEISYQAKGDQEALSALRSGSKNGYYAALKGVALTFEQRSQERYVSPWQIGTLYTRAGEEEAALDWLERAYQSHDPNMPYLSADPIFDDLRSHDRFLELLRKMQLPLEPHPLTGEGE